ncbi:MAG: A/G-specific adenine glycosylase [Patescibacteria group bacterium]
MNQKERRFVKTVWDFYSKKARHDLQWRKKKHCKPYDILVSEVMLQQTQVSRVEPKYRDFMMRWGMARQLAAAPLGEVLRMWQGLGYNSRAKRLWEAAQVVTNDLKGTFPKTYDGLLDLPGVGPYTAGAVMAFAYNQAVPIIETNIRTVYLHHFFKNQTDVDDKEILKLVEKTLDRDRAREWYWALMDYGSHLKQTEGNNTTQSKQYAKQSTFKGSDRQIRGAIIRLLSSESCTRKQLHKLPFDELRVDAQLEKLLAEGIVSKERTKFQLPT